MTQPVTLSSAYRFFVPLIFMTELNMISKSVINAALARSPDQNIVLAAFHIAFTLYFALSSSTEVCALLSVSYLKTRRALRHLLRFMVVIVTIPWLIAQALAWTSFGDWVYGGLFGASAQVVEQAKMATFFLSLSAPILVMRSISFALILNRQRTILITYANIVRLVSLVIAIFLLPYILTGASVGALALVTCMAAETLVVIYFARNFFRDLPSGDETDRTSETPPSFGQQWKFSWPLMLNSSAEMGVATVISIFLGLLSNPDLALAAFNVVYGLVSLLMSPMRNLVQTAQTLVKTIADRRPLYRFSFQLIGFFACIAALIFYTPLENIVLVDIMALKPELRDYCAPAMKLAFLMAAAWAFSALHRGLLAGARATTMLAASGLTRIAIATFICSATLIIADLNGAVVGILAWISGYTMEAVLLFVFLRHLDRKSSS